MISIPKNCKKCGAPLYQNAQSKRLICEYCGELYENDKYIDDDRYIEDDVYEEEVIYEEANDSWEKNVIDEVKNWKGEYDVYEDDWEGRSNSYEEDRINSYSGNNSIRDNIERQRQKAISNFIIFFSLFIFISLVCLAVFALLGIL